MELTNLNVQDGERIFLQANGSVEGGIWVQCHQGCLVIEGPQNGNKESYSITLLGPVKNKK